MNCLQDEWPEPVVRVQSLSESGQSTIPDRYIKPLAQRPAIDFINNDGGGGGEDMNIPLIDLEPLNGDDAILKTRVLESISEACKEWGFFQVINHGVRPELMDQTQHVWRSFFHLSMEEKEAHSNSPKTYEGYGSRLGVQKGAILDWGDYYFLHCLPLRLKDYNKWPSSPPSFREVLDEYSEGVMKLCSNLLRFMSTNLGLRQDYLQNAFGGHDIGSCLRANFYPKCPQPELTLGLSSHSDPGGLTLLLPDQHVAGLQVRKDGKWLTVKPASHAFIVNIGDQVEVMSNGIYKSVEHRVITNSNNERLSIAFFYNPKSDLLIQPARELVTPDQPSMYDVMTFDQYRLYIRTRGPQGKSQVESLKSPR
ncbi:jasmonate-induced oxygenase 2-like [Impatiens glandulifera]|uniref:jasmonate-induced oxygenase 2-like n=1 Tax=Impatiens glandulifera TaxID=253017 RepID=UPI001FB176BB|nr:jasmonate-induced oxygenase 2-like [Impatiens glandulifera]